MKDAAPEAVLLLIVHPSLLAAFAFKHAHGSARQRIEHGPELRRLLAARGAEVDRVGIEAGKDLVLKIAIHGDASPLGQLIKYKSAQLFPKLK